MPKSVDKIDKKAIQNKKTKAVELWRETRGHISNISRALGINRQTFYNWLNSDRDFALTLAEAESELNDEVRDTLIQKIAEGNMQAIIFYLKHRHKDFQETSPLQTNETNILVIPSELVKKYGIRVDNEIIKESGYGGSQIEIKN